MKKILDSIDSAVKRLASPTAMVVAAVLLADGIKNAGSNATVITVMVWILSLSALGYVGAAYYSAFKEIEESGYSKWVTGFISLAFIPVYFVLVVVAIKFGVSKVG